MNIYLIKNPITYDIQQEKWISKDIWIAGSSFADKEHINDGSIKTVDASGKILLPGIIDIHNDAVENFFSPKRNVFSSGTDILDKLMIGYYANGITSANIAITYSLEPGVRNADKAQIILREIKEYKKQFRFPSSIKVNLRIEISADWSDIFRIIDNFREEIAIVTLCDHSPNNLQNWSVHKYYRYITTRCQITDSEFDLLITEMKINKDKNMNNLHDFYCALKARNITIGVHDMCCTTEYDTNIDFGEFPTNIKIIDYLHREKKFVILGTPNIRNGGSINNNISSYEACKLGKCDILCSDYDRNSVLPSVGILNPDIDTNLYESYKRLSENPARLLGVKKGVISPGYDADCILIDQDLTKPHVYKTFVKGELAYESCF